MRSRLIASHVVLLLIVIPLLGVALIYLFESKVVLVNLGRQLTGQAVLVGELLKQDDLDLRDGGAARDFVARNAPLFPGDLSLFDGAGRLLATSDVEDSNLGAESTDLPGLPQALAGQEYTRVRYSRNERAEVVDVLVPITGADGRVLAVVRITDYLSSVQERFARVRTLTGGVLAPALVAGSILGYFLGITVERPLLRLTRAVEAYPQQAAPVLPIDKGPQEVRVLTRAFQSMLDRIAQLEENRRYLLSNIVHELGRPLGAMRAAGHALLDGADGEPELRRDLLNGIDGEIVRLERLLDELSRLREGRLGRQELDIRPAPLGEWLAGLLAPWREAALAAGLSWEADLPPDLPTISIDAGRLGQAFGNLLSNAVKFTAPGGRISVSVSIEPGASVEPSAPIGADASVAEGAWCFSIRNTGPGIPETDRERIFEPFYRTPPDRSYPQGLGLGLPIARDIVLAHGGQLTLDSCPGEGVCFIVRLPLQPSSQAPLAARIILS